MSTTLLAPGFADPAHDAQRLFRSVLDAFSHPGRIGELHDAAAGPGTQKWYQKSRSGASAGTMFDTKRR